MFARLAGAYNRMDQEAILTGYASAKQLVSPTTDKLRDEIFYNFGPWPDNVWVNRTDIDLYSFLTIDAGRPSMQYSKIDLFTLLPAVFWDNLEPKCEAGDPLALNIDAARTQDKVVRLDRSNNLDWSNVPHTKTILGTLGDWIKAFANVVVSIGNLLLSGVKALLQLGFAAFLRLAGITAQQLDTALSKLGMLASLLYEIALSPLAFAKTLIAGALQGFKTFAGDILNQLKQAAFTWLFQKLDKLVGGLPPVPKNLTIPDITLWLLEVAGLTWNNIQKRIKARLPKQAQQALGIATKLVGNPPTVSKLETAFKDFNKEWQNASEHLSWNSIYMYLQDTLPGKVAQWRWAPLWSWGRW